MASKRKPSITPGNNAPKPPNAMSALQTVIRSNGSLDRLKEVIDASSFDLPRDDILAIALSMCCHKGRLDLVKYLLDAGANPNAAVKGRPLLPLLQAVETDRGPQKQQQTKLDAPRLTKHNVRNPDKFEEERARQGIARMEKLRLENDRLQKEDTDRHRILELLLVHNADPNSPDDKKRTPLMLAKSITVMQMLLDHGADPSPKDHEGRTALMYARQAECAEKLLDHGADIDARDDYQRTALILSIVEDEDPAVALLLIKRHGLGNSLRNAGIEAADEMGRTVLVTAVWKNRLAVVTKLIEQGANVSKKDNRGRNVLHHFTGDSDRRLEDEDGPGPMIFRLLLAKVEPGDLKTWDSRKRTPLHWAASIGHLFAVRTLLGHTGVDVDAREHKSKTALHLAVRLAPSLDGTDTDQPKSDAGSVHVPPPGGFVTSRDKARFEQQQKMREKQRLEEQQKRAELLRRLKEVVSLLLEHKADVDAEAEGGWTPLHVACREQYAVEVIELLLAKTRSVDQRTHTGRTAFHIACDAGNVKVVEHLLSNTNVKVLTRDNSGNTPLLSAASCGHIRTSPLASCGHKEIIQLLAPWSRRQASALSQEAKAAAEQFQATVVDFGEYKRGNEVKKVKVFDLLYKAPGTSPAEKMSTSTLCSGSTRFRWIHLPSNNVTWCQDLLTKRFIEEGAEDGPGFKALQRSFLHQHGGTKLHSNYMRAQCVTVARSKPNETMPPAPPLSTPAPRLSVSFAAQSETSSQMSEDDRAPPDTTVHSSSLRADEPAQPSGPSMRRLDTELSASLGAARDGSVQGGHLQNNGGLQPNAHEPQNARLLRRSSTINSQAALDSRPPSRKVVISNINSSADHSVYMFAPYLHFETDLERQEMQAVAFSATAGGERGEKQVNFSPRNPVHQMSADELLIRAHLKPPISELHMRRTLDQSFYRTIDTEYRDNTQVVYRYAKRYGIPPDQLKVLMVDQLWMWVVGKDLLVTSFPQRWRQPREDPLNVLESTIEEINSNTGDAVDSIYDLAVLIGGRCFGTFDRSSITRDGSRFLDMFESEIGRAMESETNLFKAFTDASQQVSLDLRRRQQSLQRAEQLEHAPSGKEQVEEIWKASDEVRSYSNRKERAFDTLLDIGQETALLSEVKDIRDELDMLKMVFEQQHQVLNQAYSAMEIILGSEDELEGNPEIALKKRKISKRLEQNRRAVDHSIREVERMDKQADRIYKSMRDLLDLKQKYANAIEARYSRVQAEFSYKQSSEMASQGREGARQGQTLMVFTIATVVFLPLSFIASFFNLQIIELPHPGGAQELSLAFASKYIFGIGLSFAFACVFVAMCWDRLEVFGKWLWVLTFPQGAAAHWANKELQQLHELHHLDHSLVESKAAIDGSMHLSRSRSHQRLSQSRIRQPTLDESFVGWQV
ncbi:hypothetical protein LTR78_003762 [Recurvomyces mirabilis]|uniref:Ankyrin repeat protein n=1 Tax=Recurvomyces mirabilis TaxID=574656 RepID=A0AAE0WRB3_9PEZI|nr:hypothetical protein LTR78_003762 [Recurvomyces mirabilis]KAK5154874.1 hypothetical protein LTS14_006455 [Recurvomyces mirabilis]